MFFTLNEQYETPNYKLNIQNLEVDQSHWHSFKKIISWINELELYLVKNTLITTNNDDFCRLFLSLNKNNPRIEICQFYSVNELSTLACLCISNIPTFKPENILNRVINCVFTKSNQTIIISDITLEEWNNISQDKHKLPEDWMPITELTNKYTKYKNLFI